MTACTNLRCLIVFILLCLYLPLNFSTAVAAFLPNHVKDYDRFNIQANRKSVFQLDHVYQIFGIDRASSRTFSTRRSDVESTSTPRKVRTVRDRSVDETRALIRDIVQTLLAAGPRAGPARTLQAVSAIVKTSNEFLQSTAASLRPTARFATSVEEQLPVLLRTFFERMGSTYIKLGQFIASSPSLFPAAYVKEFQKCLDSTEPLPWNVIRSVIEREIGPINQTFKYVDEVPLASASIAQVHAAKLRTGEDVVIKVQKPGIENVLQADLGFLFIASRILEFIQPDWERTSLSAVAGDLRTSMLEELDFTLEARNTIEFRRFLQQSSLLNMATAPLVYLQHSSKRVLVLERLQGVSLLDEKTISKHSSTSGVESILTALNIWTLSISKMPWFHADVHAGNLMLLDDGRIGFIDFGIVGRISPQVFNAVNELSIALMQNDAEGMARAMCNMGATDSSVNIRQFGRDIERLLERMNTIPTDVTILTNGNGVTDARAVLELNDNDISDLLIELVQVTETNGLKLPREFGLLVKQSLYFDRYLKILAPDVNVMEDERVRGIGVGSQRGAPNLPADEKDRVVIDV
jgi:aarF domain-containing kinase